MAQSTRPPESASRHYAFSALLAARGAREATRVRGRGIRAVVGALWSHQVAQAKFSERAVAAMLEEQEIQAEADLLLNGLSFTTDAGVFEGMSESVGTDAEFSRLVESLIQDAGRAAESVAVAARHDIYHVRYLSPPSCGRCAVLAGRVYRWSDGFQRHPNCDCVMIPTTVAAPYAQDPVELLEQGLVRGLSKADTRAVLRDGADLGQVVNVRRRAAGLSEPGRVLARAGRPTPEGIYRMAGTDRELAVELLVKFGYGGFAA